MESGERLAELGGHALADLPLVHQPQHPAGHRLAVDPVGHEERAADEPRVGADRVDVRHRDAVPLGQGPHAGLGGERVELDLGRRQDRRHQPQRARPALGVEQHVGPAGPRRRRGDPRDGDRLVEMAGEEAREPGGESVHRCGGRAAHGPSHAAWPGLAMATSSRAMATRASQARRWNSGSSSTAMRRTRRRDRSTAPRPRRRARHRAAPAGGRARAWRHPGRAAVRARRSGPGSPPRDTCASARPAAPAAAARRAPRRSP